MSPNPPVSVIMHEWNQPKLIEAIFQTGLKPGRATERLGLTVHQIELLVAAIVSTARQACRRANGPARQSQA